MLEVLALPLLLQGLRISFKSLRILEFGKKRIKGLYISLKIDTLLKNCGWGVTLNSTSGLCHGHSLLGSDPRCLLFSDAVWRFHSHQWQVCLNYHFCRRAVQSSDQATKPYRNLFCKLVRTAPITAPFSSLRFLEMSGRMPSC